MIYTLEGKLIIKKTNFVVLQVGGIGLKISVSIRTLASLPQPGSDVKFFCNLYVREDRMDIYGFLTEEELGLFELLNSVPGIGPKTAMDLLAVDNVDNVMVAIVEGRPELLTRVSGVGKKTAERIVFELKNKIKGKEVTGKLHLDIDLDLEDALVSFGYQKKYVKEALAKLPADLTTPEERIKAALKLLSKK